MLKVGIRRPVHLAQAVASGVAAFERTLDAIDGGEVSQGDVARAVRMRAGLDQSQLGIRFGFKGKYPGNHVSKWERGEEVVPWHRFHADPELSALVALEWLKRTPSVSGEAVAV